MISSKKQDFLRLNTQSHKKLNIHLKNRFIQLLRQGELNLKFPTFIFATIASALGLFTLNLIILHNIYLAIASGITGLFIPYLALKSPNLLQYLVDNTNAYKEFISILQSALRSTNSTTEALRIASQENVNNKEIDEILDGIFKDLQLGDSITDALDKAEEKTNNKHMRMALTILKINHEIGTAKTLDALNNIDKDLDNTIENVKLLRDQINGVVQQKMIFFFIVLACPIFLNQMGNNLAAMYFETPVNNLIYCGLIFGSLLLQFMVDKQTENAMTLV